MKSHSKTLRILKRLYQFITRNNAPVIALELAIFVGIIFALAAEDNGNNDLGIMNYELSNSNKSTTTEVLIENNQQPNETPIAAEQASEDPGKPAYQMIIPNGPGDETELFSVGGENWFAVSSEYKEVEISPSDIAAASSTGSLTIDPKSPQLGWPSNDIIALDENSYETFGGEQRKSEATAKYYDYVYGTGGDLYQLEDTPQAKEAKIRPITKVRVYILSEGLSWTRIKTNGTVFEGEKTLAAKNLIHTDYKINPSTQEPWTWQEIDNLQAGIGLEDGKNYFVYVEVELVVHSQSFYPITPVEVGPPASINTWTNIDVSASVPAGATGVILHMVNTSAGALAASVRKNGSSDGRTGRIDAVTHNWAAMGVDASRIFQAYVGSTTAIDIYLVGYTVSGVTFLTNAVNKSLNTVDTWFDINASAQAPNAIGLIFENYSWGFLMGVRKNGSTDNRTNYPNDRHDTFSMIIGSDTSQIIDGYIQTGAGSSTLFLSGYITDGATFYTNATDVSLSGTAAWTDLTALPVGAVMGFIEVVDSTGGLNYGLQKNGSAENIYRAGNRHPWGFVEADASGIIEGEISNTGVDFFVVGYANGPFSPPRPPATSPSGGGFLIF